jgi:hypothetical protein
MDSVEKTNVNSPFRYVVNSQYTESFTCVNVCTERYFEWFDLSRSDDKNPALSRSKTVCTSHMWLIHKWKSHSKSSLHFLAQDKSDEIAYS